MKEYKIYKIKGNYKKIINILNLKMDREKSVKYNVKNNQKKVINLQKIRDINYLIKFIYYYSCI